MTAVWPPTEDASTVWHELPAIDPDGEPPRPRKTRLRVVRLWGSDVLIDEQARVVCQTCLELLPVEELGSDLFGPGSAAHRLGMPWVLPAAVSAAGAC